MNLMSHDITRGEGCGDDSSDTDYYNDNSSCNSYDSNTGPGSRKRRMRTPLSFQLRINATNGNGNGSSSNGCSDDETQSSRDTTADATFVSDLSTSTAATESKVEQEDDDLTMDLPTPTATAKAATATNTEDVNELLSQELLKMSLHDRTDVQEEIHGVQCLSVEESPELVQRALQDFQKQLDALPDFKKKTYIQIASVAKEAKNQHRRNHSSQIQPPPPPKHYAIDDKDFRLRFLRAELFDSKRAVLRFVNYFEFVHEFWGFGIVSQRQIRLSDFSKEELKFFKKGYFQLLPFRDRSGRRVVVILGESNKKKNGSYDTDPTTKAKCYFYLWDVASRDSVESQKKGVVAIAHPNGICFELQNHELYLVHRLSVSVPTRMVASHNFCHDFSGYKLLAKVVVAHVISGGKHKQIIRQKFHVGMNGTEMLYYLQGFGIPIQFFPLTETGTIKLNYFNKWMKTRSFLETRDEESARINHMKSKGSSAKKKNRKNLVVVECPLLNDVVFRQGKPYKANPGNDVLRDSILEELNRKMLASMELNEDNNSDHKKSNGHSKNGSGINSGSNHSNGGGTGGLDSSTEQFCNWLVEEIEVNRKGRFLTWDSGLNSWIQMSDRFKIRRKISVSLYNYEKRHNAALGKKMQTNQTTQTTQPNQTTHHNGNSDGNGSVKQDEVPSSSTASAKGEDYWKPESSSSSATPSLSFLSAFGLGAVETPSSGGMEEDDLAYRFIEGGKQSSSQFCCAMPLESGSNNRNTAGSSMVSGGVGGERKRSREWDFFLTQLNGRQDTDGK